MGPAYAPTIQTVPSPSSPVILEDIGTVRGIRLARLTFYPVLPEGGNLRFFRHIRVEVRFSGAAPSGIFGDDPLLSTVRRAVLNPQHALPALPAAQPTEGIGNPQGGPREAFLEISRPGLYRVTYQDLQSLGFAGANPANFRLLRGEDEVAYEWSGDEDAAFEPGESILFYAEPRFSRWTNVDVYRLVLGEGAPRLRITSRTVDPSGPPVGTPWVEWIFEENRIYMPASLVPGIPSGRDGDRWVWADMRRGASSVFSTTFALNGDTSFAANLTLWMIGYTSVSANPDHRVAVVLNGVSLGQVEWDGKTAVTATLSIPPTVLAPTNTLRLSLPGIPGVSVEGAWLDGFALQLAGGTASWGDQVVFATSLSHGDGQPADLPYRLHLPLVVRGGSGDPQMRAYTVRLNPSRAYRAYDITDPLRPVRVLALRVDGQQVTLADPGDRPRRYIVATEEAVRPPNRIRAREDLWGFHAAGGATGADYLIITHPVFADDLAPLVNLRRSQGLLWVGEGTAFALHCLGPLVNLRRSQGLSVSIINVLGIYDTYGDGRPDPEAIRRFIADAYAHWNPRPAYVLLVGDGSYDPKRYRSESPPTFIPPYLLDVGPAGGETAADNRYVCVDGKDNLPDLLLGRLPVKTADEARAVVQKMVDYETRPLPGGWNGTVILVADDPDLAGNFPALSDATAAWVTAPFTVTRRYCMGTEPAKDDGDAEAPTVRTALLGDWNRGAFLIQYFGHSSWQQWARERFFHLDDLSSLANSRRYPVVTGMTCFTGAFHRPEPTLDEALITRPEAGAVAAWGPTGLGASSGHSRLADGFFRAVFSDTVATVGEAALAGKLNLAGAPQGSDLLDTYVLLGDPALRWNRVLVPWAAHVFLPVIQRH
jgi:hypothetical protein